MKNRQYSLKVFETRIDDEKMFVEFFETNYVLFKDHLILIKGEMSSEIKKYLTQKPLHFFHNETLPIGRTRKALEEELKLDTSQDNVDEKMALQEALQEQISENELSQLALEEALKEQVSENELNQHIAKRELNKASNKLEELSKKLKDNFLVLDSIIRSGRELNIEGDLLLLNRVNSGATIHTTGNLIITQVVEGALRCDGSFMMITVSPKANIIFNGVEVDNDLLKDKLNRIELKGREIFITPVIKKEINWAS